MVFESLYLCICICIFCISFCVFAFVYLCVYICICICVFVLYQLHMICRPQRLVTRVWALCITVAHCPRNVSRSIITLLPPLHFPISQTVTKTNLSAKTLLNCCLINNKIPSSASAIIFAGRHYLCYRSPQWCFCCTQTLLLLLTLPQ